MNFIDIIVLVVIGLSALIAVSSGFVNVVLWILSWVGAVAATVFFFPTARPIADKYISEPLIANVVTAVVIFLVALFICAILNQIISRIVRGSGLGALDRSLGLVLGLVLGAVIVCAAYMLMVWAIPDPKDRPEALNQARTLPMVEKGAEILRSMVPNYVIEKGAAVIGQGVQTIEKGQSVNDTIQKLNGTMNGSPDSGAQPGTGNAPAGTPGNSTGQTQGFNQGDAQNPNANPNGQASAPGYKDAERNDLNRLIESSQ
ncbi:MAG TPA: CvpA family protein [Dongiaceae bacterium]